MKKCKSETINYSTEKLPQEYYSFSEYNTKMRILSYWYQINEILSTQPTSILEIGIGSGLVTSYLKYLGIKVKTLDINKNLNPDFQCSVLDIENNGNNMELYDVVVCCRVLHHIQFEKLGQALENIHKITKKYVVISLPVDEARLYFMNRYTSSSIFVTSIKIPKFFKFFYSYIANKKIGSGLWQLNSSKDTTIKNVNSIIKRNFKIIREYHLPEDGSHYMYLLEKI
jgi:SAM-dependent methyltransferase